MEKAQVNIMMFAEVMGKESFSKEAFFELVKLGTIMVQAAKQGEDISDIFGIELDSKAQKVVNESMEALRGLPEASLTATEVLLGKAAEIVTEEGIEEITLEVAHHLKDVMAQDPAMAPYIQEMERAA